MEPRSVNRRQNCDEEEREKMLGFDNINETKIS
jgi:hypothetical protein